MLLERHRSGVLNILVLRTFGRIVAIAMAVYVTVPLDVTSARAATAAVVSAVSCLFWLFEVQRQTLQLLRLEEILGRRTGGDPEELYIESRYYVGEASPLSWLTGYEPILWLAVVGFAIAAGSILQS